MRCTLASPLALASIGSDRRARLTSLESEEDAAALRKASGAASIISRNRRRAKITGAATIGPEYVMVGVVTEKAASGAVACTTRKDNNGSATMSLNKKGVR